MVEAVRTNFEPIFSDFENLAENAPIQINCL